MTPSQAGLPRLRAGVAERCRPTVSTGLRSRWRDECQHDSERAEQEQRAPEEVARAVARRHQVSDRCDEDPGTYDYRDEQPGLEAEMVTDQGPIGLAIFIHAPNLRATSCARVRELEMCRTSVRIQARIALIRPSNAAELGPYSARTDSEPRARRKRLSPLLGNCFCASRQRPDLGGFDHPFGRRNTLPN